MGNANITVPGTGWQDPKLAQVFAVRRLSNKTTPINTTTLINIATPTTTNQANDYSQSRLPVGIMAGAIVGGLVLLTAGFFLLWRRQRMAASLQLPEMPSSTEPQELQECGLYELDDFRNVPELPSLPTELDSSVPLQN